MPLPLLPIQAAAAAVPLGMWQSWAACGSGAGRKHVGMWLRRAQDDLSDMQQPAEPAGVFEAPGPVRRPACPSAQHLPGLTPCRLVGVPLRGTVPPPQESCHGLEGAVSSGWSGHFRAQANPWRGQKDVFGQSIPATASTVITCTNCGKRLAASRWAPPRNPPLFLLHARIVQVPCTPALPAP